MLWHLILYLVSFVLIWFGSGLIVSTVTKFAHRLKISSFSLSFFILGLLTSIPEISVGLNSVFENKPEIFVGNLIGASIVIFILIIPILAVFGNGISLKHQLSDKNLLMALFVIVTPVLLISDRNVNLFEGVVLLYLYLLLFYIIEKKQGLTEKLIHQISNHNRFLLPDFIKIILGVGAVILSSYLIVENTIYFAKLLNLSTFFVSLIVLGIGTNLPELSLAIRSVKERKNEVAFGDYIGSAAANTGIFGFLTIINGAEILLSNHYYQYFIFIILGLGLFYLFIRSKNDISRKEGLILLVLYFIFIVFEIKNNF